MKYNNMIKICIVLKIAAMEKTSNSLIQSKTKLIMDEARK
jgi:hypothetical protein